mgnify:CR=1 FL=1
MFIEDPEAEIINGQGDARLDRSGSMIGELGEEHASARDLIE